MENKQDFVITKGVLEKYKGPGGDVTIPEGVKKIGPDVFCGRRLQSVTIPKSVREISTYAFGESSIQSVTIPKSVRSIGHSAFSDCENLTSVTFQDREDAVGIIGDLNLVFDGCPNIANVAIPRCMAGIAIALFEDTLWLKNLGEFAVLDHFLIKYQGTKANVVIPEEIEELGWRSFAGCKNLTSVTIPESVTEIGVRAFRGCGKLQSVTIPESIKKIGSDAFKDTPWRERLGALVVINYCLLNYLGEEKDVILPEGLEEIGDSTFQNCASIQSVTIPDSVIKIGNWAFSKCENLRSITIPENVTRLGRSAFHGCKSFHRWQDKSGFSTLFS